MKRLNPETNLPFKSGDIRSDGKIFLSYRMTIKVKKNGFYVERWQDQQTRIKEVKIRRNSTKNWQAKISEHRTEYYENYYRNNQELLKVKSQKWKKENPEKVKHWAKKWQLNNSDRVNAIAAKRRASKLQATPPWLTKEHFQQIDELYIIAKMFQMYTGQKYHVDHEVPLQGENVNGLHVPWNMTVLLAKENIAKKNKHV